MTLIDTTAIAREAQEILDRLGVTDLGGGRSVSTPITGEEIARVRDVGPAQAECAVTAAQTAFLEWRDVPAPRRGELVRLLGEALRAAKPDLGRLVTLEAGKTLSEGLGEVQEM